MSAAWAQVSLGEVLKERRETPADFDLVNGTVRIVDKVSFNDGRIHLRFGQDTKTGMILVRPGDLLVSGINAAKGAIAIHGNLDLGPLAATIHYAAYQVDPARAETKFLWWMLRSKFFREILSEYVPGGIKTELKAKRLLPVPVPLPPLDEQRRIVARIEELAAKVEQATKLRSVAGQELSALAQAQANAYLATEPADGHLAQVMTAAPRNGWSPHCDNIDGGTPVLTLSSVTGWRFQSTAIKRTSHPTRADAHYWAEKGDLLMTRSNTPELVGHAAIHNGSPSRCIYPDLMMKLPIDPRKASVRFVWYWLQTSSARDFVRRSAKGTSPTMKKISQGVVQSIPFPTQISLEDQIRVTSELDALQDKVDAVKVHQDEIAAELDAMLPAILDKAFKGELI